MLGWARKTAGIALFLAICLIIVTFNAQALASPERTNVIVLMTDGTGSTHTTIARWFKGSGLSLDEMIAGGVRTYSAESIVTDSAPAATAFATGHKTNTKFIGVLPEKTGVPGVEDITADLQYKPVASVLEGAKLVGKSVGLVATSNIQHASPAAFSAHWPYRDDYNCIAKQQVYLNIDVVFSGGKQYLLPKAQGGLRTDGENLIDVLKSRGYTFIETKDELKSAKADKVWGLFAKNDLAYDFDRQELAPNEPSLAEMTQKAIELLSHNNNGFFLFVEGSKVDWASHANDPVGVVSDVLAFEKAVETALDFAKKDGHTLVLAFTDHSNGGMSIGNSSYDKNYDKMPFADLVTPLKKAELTAEGIEKMLAGDLSASNIRLTVFRYYGIEDLTDEEVAEIQQAPKGRMNYVLGPIFSKRTPIGWTTHGHSGEDVFFYAYGIEHPVGLIQNTQIAHMCAQKMGFSLSEVDSKLFINVEQAAATIGAKVSIDTGRNLLIVEKGLIKAEVPFNTNMLKIGNKTYELSGISVYAPVTKRAYIPQQAVDLLKTAM